MLLGREFQIFMTRCVKKWLCRTELAWDLFHVTLTFIPLNLIGYCLARTMMNYPCCKFGNCSLISFGRRAFNMFLHFVTLWPWPLTFRLNINSWARTHLKHDIEAVENVQRRFTKRLPGFKKFSYQERLRRLDLPSLELHRLHCDLLRCYKIIFGYVDINFDDMLVDFTDYLNCF